MKINKYTILCIAIIALVCYFAMAFVERSISLNGYSMATSYYEQGEYYTAYKYYDSLSKKNFKDAKEKKDECIRKIIETKTCPNCGAFLGEEE